ncbi:hypothetical protein NKG94_06930 [Micromonospora sp. M12]
MSAPDLRRWWVRLAQTAGLVAMGLLALFDLRFGAPESVAALVLLVVRMGLAVATVPLWLPVHRPGSRLLPLAALALAGTSLAVTAAILVLSDGNYLIGGSWGSPSRPG